MTVKVQIFFKHLHINHSDFRKKIIFARLDIEI